jgi:pyruvate dehydrogenase E1 component alpha subunit
MTIVAKFEIQYLQFLDKDGKIVQPLPAFAQDPKNLIPMYRSMNLTRVMDAKAVTLQRMGKMGTYPSSLGQEAVGVGMGYGMHQDDIFVPYYRDQGAMLYRGVKMVEILGYWGGDERCNNFAAPQVREDFPISVPVGSQCLHAAGLGFAIKYHQQKRAVVCGCGDGGTSKGDFYEALNFSGVQKLPVIFVINNNQWAISVPYPLQTGAKTIAQKAAAGGFEGIQVDGNDVIAMRYAISEAIEKGRRGEGPTLIEAVTYRLSDHTTADDARRYTSEDAIKKAWQYEPILRLRNYLKQQNVWTEQDENKMLEECTAEVDQAIKEYLSMTAQSPTDIFDYLYAKLPEEILEQRAMLQDNA